MRLLRPFVFTFVLVGILLHDTGMVLGVASQEWQDLGDWRSWVHFAVTLPVVAPLVVLALLLVAVGVFCHLAADHLDWRWEERWPSLAITGERP
jgi:hypothetical protein